MNIPPDHTCANCPRPADRQRSRVYDAERAVVEEHGGGHVYRRLAAVKAAANAVVSSEWWLARFRFIHPLDVYRMPPEVDAGADSCPGTGEMRFSRDHQAAVWLAHELAHQAQPHGTAWHGPEFAACYLALAEHLCGAPYAAAMAAAFRDAGIRVATPHLECAA